MGCDVAKDFKGLISGNNFSINFNIEDEKKGEDLFKKISKGGIITMPFEKTFWAKNFGMCTDRFGINWMINIA